MTKLCDIAFNYGADKCPKIKHHYTPFYYELFKFRKESIKKVIEVGVGYRGRVSDYPDYKNGASLYMWRDFFPNAQIYGIDILPGLVFKDKRIETFRCDQTVKGDLENLIKKTGSDIDLFVDDGSHKSADQVFTCLTVMPLLKKDVIYVIEDVSDPNIINRFTDYDCRLIDFEDRRRLDDRLILVRNKC
jgi:hypothetical protein